MNDAGAPDTDIALSGRPSQPDQGPNSAPNRPVVIAQQFTKEQQEKFKRQNKYNEDVLAGWKNRRVARRIALKSRATVVRQALAEYKKIDRGDLEDVRIRTEFVRLENKRPERVPGETYVRADDLDTRPPLTRLVNRKNASLRVLMSAIYVAHLEIEPGKPFVNNHSNVFADGSAPWWRLCGQHVDAPVGRTNREHGRTLNRALAMLNKHGLAEIGARPGAGQYNGWLLKSEAADGHAYTVPAQRRSPERVRVPRGFFERGWHLVLEPGEIATFLAVLELTQRLAGKERKSAKDIGVALGQKVRWERYGLSEDTYLEALHALDEFGLIDVVDPMPHRRRGKVSPSRPNLLLLGGSDEQIPYRVVFPPTSVSTPYHSDAVDVVLSRLDNPVPLWLDGSLTDERIMERSLGR